MLGNLRLGVRLAPPQGRVGFPLPIYTWSCMGLGGNGVGGNLLPSPVSPCDMKEQETGRLGPME